jgi:hypothetical protein
MPRVVLSAGLLALIALAGCGDESHLPVEVLQDPTTCNECHAEHYTQWSSSMHAYATDDPVFRAMNARGQRETNGTLGTFCVQCHAPMATALGLTDGTNLDAIPDYAKGVTCYFCHNVDKVTDTHNNPIVLANDDVMRGGVEHPVTSTAHGSKYDTLMDSDGNDSSMCGSCHDVVTPAGVALERTFAEWQTTFFSTPDDPEHHLSCGNCHMHSSTDVIAMGPSFNVPIRAGGFHAHTFPGIDQALTDFPGADLQATAIKNDLDPAIGILGPVPLAGPPGPGGICVNKDNTITVRLDGIGIGHRWPTGVAQDRRAWLEVVATGSDGSVLFQSGVVPDGVDPDDPSVTGSDAQLFGMWDLTYKDTAKTMPAHFFWEVQAEDPSKLLKAPTTLNPNDPAFDHSSTATFHLTFSYQLITHITARVHIRPLPFAVVNDLVATGDLDPSIPPKLPTLDILGTERVWDISTAGTGLAADTGCSPIATE